MVFFYDPFCYNYILIDILGDTEYVLKPWMLIPFEGTQDDTPEVRHNYSHSSDRNAVERCIGVLKERFR